MSPTRRQYQLVIEQASAELQPRLVKLAVMHQMAQSPVRTNERMIMRNVLQVLDQWDLPEPASPMKAPKNFEVHVGGYYVGGEGKAYLIRHITGTTFVDGRELLCWESYHTDTGKATRDSMACSQGHLYDWAGREATPEEIARLVKDQPTYKEEMLMKMYEQISGRVLYTLSDEEIINEARRRGYHIVKD